MLFSLALGFCSFAFGFALFLVRLPLLVFRVWWLCHSVELDKGGLTIAHTRLVDRPMVDGRKWLIGLGLILLA